MFAPREMLMKAIVADRGQVTIPKELRDKLGISPRTALEFKEENGRLVAEKAVTDDPVAKVTGVLSLKKDTDALIEELRNSN